MFHPFLEMLESRRRNALRREQRRMKLWCELNRNNRRVVRWIRENPPPEGWKGTALQYAYSEMPSWMVGE